MSRKENARKKIEELRAAIQGHEQLILDSVGREWHLEELLRNEREQQVRLQQKLAAANDVLTTMKKNFMDSAASLQPNLKKQFPTQHPLEQSTVSKLLAQSPLEYNLQSPPPLAQGAMEPAPGVTQERIMACSKPEAQHASTPVPVEVDVDESKELVDASPAEISQAKEGRFMDPLSFFDEETLDQNTENSGVTDENWQEVKSEYSDQTRSPEPPTRSPESPAQSQAAPEKQVRLKIKRLTEAEIGNHCGSTKKKLGKLLEDPERHAVRGAGGRFTKGKPKSEAEKKRLRERCLAAKRLWYMLYRSADARRKNKNIENGRKKMKKEEDGEKA